MRADWTVHREDGVALVSVNLRAEPPRRVRVEHTGDGPLWPPREAGVPAAGWEDGGWTGVVDGRRMLGFATPEAGDPPVRVEWHDSPEAGAGGGGFDRHPDVPGTAPTTAGVVRSLGPTGPPRDAVPTPAPARSPPAGRGPEPTAGAGASRRRPEVGRVGDVRGEGGDDVDATGRSTGGGAERATDGGEVGVSDGTAAEENGFDAVERRVAAAETLATAGTLPELSDAVAEVGGLDGAYDLEEHLQRDRERLRVTEKRAGALRERLAGVEIPLERLERLA